MELALARSKEEMESTRVSRRRLHGLAMSGIEGEDNEERGEGGGGEGGREWRRERETDSLGRASA